MYNKLSYNYKIKFQTTYRLNRNTNGAIKSSKEVYLQFKHDIIHSHTTPHGARNSIRSLQHLATIGNSYMGQLKTGHRRRS